MAISFASPSYRAASSDLTIAISPLGLVELADEEFEVHGPRLNRYAQNWAFYLGHHWGYRPEVGESQVTSNYVRAFSDFLTNFTFSRGMSFLSPDSTSAIVPTRLKRIWEEDNNKKSILWEMGNTGSVSGDVFAKIAYEEAWVDPAKMRHPGRVRIIPLNPAFCFPEWHPHDRNRLIRFKLKYRFWGTTLEGTRQVFTYTELLTDSMIEEFVNDEIMEGSPRENPLGTIPIAFAKNLPVSSSPWGLSDIQDIIGLNREYNEKATEVSTIINYHSAPVTVLIGGKASNLERGPKKVWGIPNEKAKIQNLESNPEGAQFAMEYMDRIKTTMHEMTGVPVGALGQAQPISNTSGVALAIQYQPLMMKYDQKKTQYGQLIEDINYLALRTLYLKEPWTTLYDPENDPPLEDGQLEQLDPADPISYKSETQFPPPLPVDRLVKLNEIQVLLALGLESKKGALRDLGEEFVSEKMQELFDELLNDAERQAALDLMKAQVAMVIAQLTGMFPTPNGPEPVPPPPASANGGSGGNVQSAGGPGVNAAGAPGPMAGPLPGVANILSEQDLQKLTQRLVALASGTQLPQRRTPEPKED